MLSSEEHLCLIKVIVFKPKNLVVGLHMCGPETAEVIQGFAVAMRLGMTMNQLQTFVGISATGVQGMTSLKERENEKKNENE